WSDRLSEIRRKELVAKLRAVLPQPRRSARCERVCLSGSASAAAVAGRFQAQPGFAWLDSASLRHDLFRDPIARIHVRDRHAVVEGPGDRVSLEVRGLDLLEAAVEAWAGAAGALLCGYFAYELGAELEDLAVPLGAPEDLPDLVLGLYDSGLVQRNGTWQVWRSTAWRDRGHPSTRDDACGAIAEASREPADDPGPSAAAPVGAAGTGEDFKAAVARTVRRIYDGEIFQVNLCRRLETAIESSAIWPAYVRMRQVSPGRHAAFLRLSGECAVLSVSPELFLRVRGGLARSRPIKGTRPRGLTHAEDSRLALELLESEKDRAELAMIVDVVRNDLGRVCAPGSVSVVRHAQLMSLATVHHTFSEVSGRLRSDVGPADLLRACFPPASISGAPKIRAIEVAALEEARRRGPCMGSAGWISLDGEMELSVAIRTAVASCGRIWYLAGCGITAESDPEAELAESEAKAAAFIRALSAAPKLQSEAPAGEG